MPHYVPYFLFCCSASASLPYGGVRYFRLLLSWCFTSIENIRLIRNGECGRGVGGWEWRGGWVAGCGAGGRVEMNSSSKLSDPQRRKRPPATDRTTMLRRWRSTLCTSLTAVSTAALSNATKPVSEKQLLRNNSAARRSTKLREPSSTSLLLNSPGL